MHPSSQRMLEEREYAIFNRRVSILCPVVLKPIFHCLIITDIYGLLTVVNCVVFHNMVCEYARERIGPAHSRLRLIFHPLILPTGIRFFPIFNLF